MIIIGGGFSGTMLAARLAALGVACALVEDGRVGRGVAYATDDPAHLLNVRAERMSAWGERPSDFADYAGEGADEDWDGFARRMVFGDYVAGVLAKAETSGLVKTIEGRAVAARKRPLHHPSDGPPPPENRGRIWRVELANGREIEGERLLLATGNSPPRALGVAGAVDDPWSEQGRASILAAAEDDAAVLIVGTGLTGTDVVLSLRRLGHRGTITALSRRGLVHRAHGPVRPPLVIEREELPRGLVAMMRWVRKTAAESGDWRAVVEGLRPHTQAIWRSWSLDEQRRFLRHARPWWDVHRHRIAPRVAAEIKEAVAEGQLEIVAGRLVRIRDSIAVIAKRPSTSLGTSGGLVERPAEVVINATGPGGVEDALISQLIADGIASRDALGLGLAVEDDDRLSGRDDAWAVGPPTKGMWWEIVAVPDIRVQVARVGEAIFSSLGTKVG